ncbi:MAG: rRNA maturation RNase YbeY [Nitrospinae bacterium]|nr:rRNA maturation RNase YbeY [Nitrospinota bacterium]
MCSPPSTTTGSSTPTLPSRRREERTMTVRVTCRRPAKGAPPSATLEKTAARLLTLLGVPEAELSLSLIGDGAMRELNLRWRGKDYPTDVLSFPQLDDEELPDALRGNGSGILLGDVVISVDTARRQAKERGLALDEEIDRLLVHGMLHLVGYDHERGPNDARSQRAKENALLKKLRG